MTKLLALLTLAAALAGCAGSYLPAETVAARDAALAACRAETADVAAYWAREAVTPPGDHPRPSLVDVVRHRDRCMTARGFAR